MEVVYTHLGETPHRNSPRSDPGFAYAPYADDALLIASTPADMQTLLHHLERAASVIGFSLNLAKCVDLAPAGSTQRVHHIIGTPVPQQTQADYLGGLSARTRATSRISLTAYNVPLALGPSSDNFGSATVCPCRTDSVYGTPSSELNLRTALAQPPYVPPLRSRLRAFQLKGLRQILDAKQARTNTNEGLINEANR